MHLSLSPTERRQLDAIQRMSPDAKARWLDNQAKQADTLRLDPPPRPGVTSAREIRAMMVASKRQRLERLCYLNEARLIALEHTELLRSPPKKTPRLTYYRDKLTALCGPAAEYRPPQRRPFIANGRPQPGMAWERDFREPTGWRLVHI